MPISAGESRKNRQNSLFKMDGETVVESQIIQAIGGDDTGLRATLAWVDDRFVQQIDWVAGNQAFRLMESVEGAADDAWPPSPALQQMSVENRSQNRQVALMVGMAGQNHWSVSIENDPQERKLTFDVACRIAEESSKLGTQYRTTSAITLLSNDHGVEVAVAGRRCQLILESTGRGESDLIQHRKGIIRIVPTEKLSTYPNTVRWKYSLFG